MSQFPLPQICPLFTIFLRVNLYYCTTGACPRSRRSTAHPIITSLVSFPSPGSGMHHSPRSFSRSLSLTCLHTQHTHMRDLTLPTHLRRRQSTEPRREKGSSSLHSLSPPPPPPRPTSTPLGVEGGGAEKDGGRTTNARKEKGRKEASSSPLYSGAKVGNALQLTRSPFSLCPTSTTIQNRCSTTRLGMRSSKLIVYADEKPEQKPCAVQRLTKR